MVLRLFPAPRHEPVPADEPIRRFVEALEDLEEEARPPAGGRVRALGFGGFPVLRRQKGDGR